MMNEKPPTPPGGSQKSLADYDAEGRAVRANMEKLRALRLAKEAAEAASAPPKAVKKAAVKKKKAEPPAKLSDWLANQQKGGFRT
jgi:hypothetical protein